MLVELALPALLTPFPAQPPSPTHPSPLHPAEPGQERSQSQQVTRPILGIVGLTLSPGSRPARSSSFRSGGRMETWLRAPWPKLLEHEYCPCCVVSDDALVLSAPSGS